MAGVGPPCELMGSSPERGRRGKEERGRGRLGTGRAAGAPLGWPLRAAGCPCVLSVACCVQKKGRRRRKKRGVEKEKKEKKKRKNMENFLNLKISEK
jgi:hypothetical protein